MERLASQSSSRPLVLLARMDSLADETRLRLLHLLEQQELGVVDLCDVLQLPQSTVSRHLKVLADQGWVRSRRLATTNLYRTLLDELDPAARKLWLLAREQTATWATLQQDALRLECRLRQRDVADSQSFFAGAAGEWDRLRRELYGETFTTAAMLAMLDRDLVVADLGCGTGPLIEQLAPHVRQVIGVDNSAPMLRAAKKRLNAFGNVDLRKGDLQALPIQDAQCDASLLLLALTYVQDPIVVLKEMARVTKPAGRAVVVDLLPHDRDDFRRELGQLALGFSPKLVNEMMTAAGFGGVKCTPLAPEPDAKGPALFLACGTRP
jgi:ArsR family transcriptional regulator